MEREQKYHVGDRVVILDYMEPGVTEEDNCCFIHSMAQYKGRTTIVTGYRKYRVHRIVLVPEAWAAYARIHWSSKKERSSVFTGD